MSGASYPQRDDGERAVGTARDADTSGVEASCAPSDATGVSQLLARLRQLDREASLAPWKAWPNGEYNGEPIFEIVAPDNAPAGIQYPDGSFDTPDAALIAEMRNALPALLACAEALERIAEQSAAAPRRPWEDQHGRVVETPFDWARRIAREALAGLVEDTPQES